MTLTVGSLFSGIGGLDLAVEAVTGGRTAWHSEVDPAASLVLTERWPDTPNLGDITAIDWAEVEPVDVICGGFPCQDISSAGRGAGIKEGTRSGLWYRYADAVRVLRPRLVFVENVAMLLVRGLGIVLADLASLGYDARWCSVRASDVGAPHRRERIFLIAWPADIKGLEGPEPARRRLVLAGGTQPATDASSSGRHRWAPSDESRVGGGYGLPPIGGEGECVAEGSARPVADTPLIGHQRSGGTRNRGPRPADSSRTTADPDGERRSGSEERHIGQVESRLPAPHRYDPDRLGTAPWGRYGPAIRRWERLTRPAPDPTEPGRGGGNPRLSPRFVEWMMGLPDGWVTDLVLPSADPRPNKISRSAALRVLGNGVVPAQAVAAFRHLDGPERVS